MLADAGAAVLVTQAALLDRLPDAAGRTGTAHGAARRRLAGDRARSPPPRRRSTSTRAIPPM